MKKIVTMVLITSILTLSIPSKTILAQPRVNVQQEFLDLDKEYEIRPASISTIIIIITNMILIYAPQINQFLEKITNNPLTYIPLDEKIRIIKENFDRFIKFMKEKGITIPGF